jgi:HlyD family secretion protein
MTLTAPVKRSPWRWLIAVLVLGGLLTGGYFLFFGKQPPPKWVTQTVTRGNIQQVVSATGTLQPLVTSPVGSQVSGIVWKLHADYNSQVKKGQVLLELDPALFQVAVKREEANMASAQAQVLRARADAHNAALIASRARSLAEKNYISMSERDTAVAQELSSKASLSAAEAGIKLAQAALDKVHLDLKNSVILSPVDGVVIARNVELGQAVVASFQAPNLFTIAEDLRKMQVLANVDEADIGYMQVGTMAQFTVDAFRGKKFAAKVSQVRNAAQTVQNVVTYVVVLEVDNTELLLKPGMTANVRLEIARRDNALLLPNAALRFKPRLDRAPSAAAVDPAASGESRRPGGRKRPDGSGKGGESAQKTDTLGANGMPRELPARVFIPDGESVKMQPIMIGISDGQFTEVVSGLEENQVVVTDSPKPAGGSSAAAGGPRPAAGAAGSGGMRRGGF